MSFHSDWIYHVVNLHWRDLWPIGSNLNSTVLSLDKRISQDLSFLFLQGRVLSCGMDDSQEQDQHEERLKEVFNSFDTSCSGSLCLDELSELCQSLHLGDATPALLRTLLRNQDHLTARVRLFVCHWIRKTVVLSHGCNFWSNLLRKAVFAFLPFVPSLVYMGDMFFGFNMCRSSTSFEFGRHLRQATPALRPLCVQAFCRFVSHLVEKMFPHQPWSQVSVVRTTKPTNHHSWMHFFEGSLCGTGHQLLV